MRGLDAEAAHRTADAGLPMTDDIPELSDELVAYYRQVLTTHATKPDTGTCPVCGVPRCPDWTYAYDSLAAAHQVMSDSPPPWEPFHPQPQGKRIDRRA